MTLDLDSIAARQLRDFDAHEPGTIFAEEISLSEEQAYAVQSTMCQLREQRGEAVIGYKIGCTSPVIQQQLKIDYPVFGRLFATQRHESGVELRSDEFAGFAIEGELAVRLSDNVPGGCADRERILHAIDGVFPVIELHNHLLRSAQPSAAELIANNAIHAGFVAPRGDSGLPPADDLPLRISLDDDTIAEVTYRNWRVAVVDAIAELSSLLERHELSLRAGHIVLTGSLAELFPVSAETKIEVATPGQSSVTATFASLGQ